MREGHKESTRAQRVCPLQCPAIEMQYWLPGWETFDFNVFPVDTGCPTGSESLERGFFSGESGGEVNRRMRASVALFLFPFGVDSRNKPLGEPFNGLSDPLVLYDIDAKANNQLGSPYGWTGRT